MSNVTAIQTQPSGSLASLDDATMQNLISGGDCSRLTPAQRTAYYVARCEAAGLDPRAQPFSFMRLNGKETLYALKACSDQLAAKHGIRTQIVSQSTDEGIRVVTVHAVAKDGRETDEIGAVPVTGLKGEALANAYMKAVTKAKRRATLSICGLGMLDETEVESIPNAAPLPAKVEVVPAPSSRAAMVQAVADSGAQANIAAAAEVLGATVETMTVSDLWGEAGREFGETGRPAAWQKACATVFGAGVKPPPAKDWTRDQIALVEAGLFPKPPPGTDGIPF